MPVALALRSSLRRHVRERADDSQRYGPLVRPLETVTAADFAPLRGDRFPIALDDAPAFEVELVEVTEISHEPGGRAPFSLVFQGGPTPPLAQRIYRVEHEELRCDRDVPRPDRLRPLRGHVHVAGPVGTLPRDRPSADRRCPRRRDAWRFGGRCTRHRASLRRCSARLQSRGSPRPHAKRPESRSLRLPAPRSTEQRSGP